MNSLIRKLLFVSALLACNSKVENDSMKLSQFIVKSSFDYEKLESVLVLTEQGCPVCNKMYGEFLEKQLQNKKVLCLISASGNGVDLSPFQESDKVLLDYNNRYQKLGISNGTCAILLRDGLIDTIIKIEAIDLDNTLEYLSEKLNN